MDNRFYRGWLTVVYPDLAPADWDKLLPGLGLHGLISPLHLSDVYTDGSDKPIHYHVIFFGEHPVKFSEAVRLIDSFGGVGLIPVTNIRGTVRYFVNWDDSEMDRLCLDDVRPFGGFDWVRCRRVCFGR